MNLTENFLSLGKKARGLNGKPIYFSKPVDLIVIHWIGPYPRQSAAAAIYWWEDGTDGKGVQASAHFCVKDDEVFQALPLNEVGWHAGDERNYRAIGIEVVPMSVSGEFSENTITTLKELINHIWKTYPEAKLVRHFDGVQKKDCPRYYTPVTSLLDGGGRIANPAGGEDRWIILCNFLTEKS